MITARDGILQRLRALTARTPWAIDVLLVVAIIAAGRVQGADHGSRADTGAWLWTVALALPLLGRRHWPTPVFAAIAAIALAQWIVGTRAFGDSAMLVAFYTVAVDRPLRETAAAALVLEIGVVLAVERWAGHPAVNAYVALSALATAAGVLGINVRNRRAMLASLHERAARLEQERDQQGRLSAAAERSRIAREMHDIVAHNLSVMIALADGASYAALDEPARAREAMQTASRTGRQALGEMRRLLGVLREDGSAEARTPQPGLHDVGALVEQVRSAGLPVTHVEEGRPPRELGAGLQLAAYRIVQEALTNTLKHAGPDVAATVTLRWQGDDLHLEVCDTGHGPATPATAEGGGLQGMRERAAVYGGTVEAGSEHGQGWQVRATLHARPIPAQVHA